MLRSLRSLEQYAVAATDGDIGRVVDFLLDTEHWALRSLVVETGDGRRVLVAPGAVRTIDGSASRFTTVLTLSQVKSSPTIDPAPAKGAAGPPGRLRGAFELRGYHVHGSDKDIGHVEDLLVDEESWVVPYLVVDTSNWWFAKKVLVAPHWATRISWEEHMVFLNMTREALKGSPEWIPTVPVNREYEGRLYAYYGRPAYWASNAGPRGAKPDSALTAPDR
jgi:sporulation protein YlmC with PRC-barrel domain